MTLGETQRLFTIRLAELIVWVYDQGYEMSFGEAYRSDEQAEINALGFDGRKALELLIRPLFPLLADKIANNMGSGIRTTLHTERLAVDLNLFKDGKLLTTFNDYLPIGEQWESMGGTWGGRFKDVYHFSVAYGGRK